MEWKKHFRRVGTLALIGVILFGGLLKVYGSGSLQFNPETKENLEEIEAVVLEDVTDDPCKSTPMLAWVTDEFGTQGCWTVQEYGVFGFRVLYALEDSDEFRRLFRELGPNLIIPVLGHALANPKAFNLFSTEDKLLDLAVRAPIEGGRKRWLAGKEVLQQGGNLFDAARAAAKSSGTMRTAREAFSREFTGQEVVVLLLHLIQEGRGSFLDQFHFTIGESGELEKVEVQYVKHGLHITTKFLTDGITTFERKYRWEEVTLTDAGWAALDVAIIGGTILKVAKLASVAKKAAKMAKPVAVAKASRMARVAKMVRVIKIATVVSAVGYVASSPWQAFKWIGKGGTWLLEQFIPGWLAFILGPFFGMFIVLLTLYILCWPMFGFWRICRALGRFLYVPAAFVVRWIFPLRQEAAEAATA